MLNVVNCASLVYSELLQEKWISVFICVVTNKNDVCGLCNINQVGYCHGPNKTGIDEHFYISFIFLIVRDCYKNKMPQLRTHWVVLLPGIDGSRCGLLEALFSNADLKVVHLCGRKGDVVDT